ncbi:hypothetical protein [Hamadaea tsunoensis]|uniref:hypothetical protein n=1 Tax=Hamadaea tsunoensis TaxID=53368 RepID=UPI0003FE6A16|nr:hypothetical protein [Hamadaea tsunoensis]
MTGFRPRLALLGGALLLLAAGCAQATSSTPGDTPAPDLAADQVAIRVAYTGGFVGPGVTLTRLPLLAIYGDGRVFNEGPVPAIYPGPALPNIQISQITPGDVAKLVDRAVAAGVGKKTDFGRPGIADATSTRFTVLTANGTQTTEVYALQEAQDNGLTADQRAAREKFKGLLADLTDLDATLGVHLQPKPYTADGVAAIGFEYNADGQLPQQKEMTWPGPALPGAVVGDGPVRCVAVTGADAKAVLDAAAQANQMTPWESGGKRWNVTFRPLLPGEEGCASLAQAQ